VIFRVGLWGKKHTFKLMQRKANNLGLGHGGKRGEWRGGGFQKITVGGKKKETEQKKLYFFYWNVNGPETAEYEGLLQKGRKKIRKEERKYPRTCNPIHAGNKKRRRFCSARHKDGYGKKKKKHKDITLRYKPTLGSKGGEKSRLGGRVKLFCLQQKAKISL